MKVKYYLEPEFNENIQPYFNEEARNALISIDEEEPQRNGLIAVYAPIGQHSQAPMDYLQTCKEITLEQYKAITEGYYTPSDYVGGAENE